MKELTRSPNKRQIACCGFAISILARNPSYSRMVFLARTMSFRSLQSGFASLALFVSSLSGGLIASFFLLALPLCATVNEPLSLAWTTGYRNDRAHWHLQEGGEGTVLASERWRDVEFWQNGLTLKVIHRDLAFALWGDYATFGRGQLSQRPSQGTSSHTTGWAADAASYFGYAVNLTPGRHYNVILLPLFGFSTHFERLKAALADQLHMTWYGFFLGGGFLFEPGNRLKFQVGYTYHWLNLRFKSSTFKVKDGSNLGQTGWAEMSYLLSCHWSIGLGAQIHYFASRVLPTSLSDQKLKLRWVPVSGWFSIARQF